MGVSLVPENVEVLRDVVVPEKFFKRISLGVQILDEIFGGTEMPGILAGATFLFTGMPGAGKSTMSLQLADLFQRHSKKNVLYNIGEENKHMIKLRADRIGIRGDFTISHYEDVNALIRFCKQNGVEVVFQDSLQSLRDRDLTGPKLLKSVVKKLTDFAHETDCTTFIVGHITKGGGFAGPQEIKHDVDAHAHLKLNPESGNRIFELQKNRFGPATMPYEFSLSANGLDFQPITEAVEAKGGTSRAADRRDNIKTLIKEKLLQGERISGYCFERFNVDCSGGFWRGMLMKACKELEQDGHKIGEVRIGGRLHNFLEV